MPIIITKCERGFRSLYKAKTMHTMHGDQSTCEMKSIYEQRVYNDDDDGGGGTGWWWWCPVVQVAVVEGA